MNSYFQATIIITSLILISQVLGSLQNIPSKAQILEATRLKERLELEHAKDPKDSKMLAIEVLQKAFSKSTKNANSISVMEIMQRLSSATGEARFYTVRILELMDSNHDGKITNEEYVAMYAEPSASVAKSLEMMHKLCDYNGDGSITKWEQLMALIVGNSDNTPMHELWKLAIRKHSEMDGDNNGLVSREEFMTFLVYQVQKNVYEQNRDYILQSNL